MSERKRAREKRSIKIWFPSCKPPPTDTQVEWGIWLTLQNLICSSVHALARRWPRSKWMNAPSSGGRIPTDDHCGCLRWCRGNGWAKRRRLPCVCFPLLTLSSGHLAESETHTCARITKETRKDERRKKNRDHTYKGTRDSTNLMQKERGVGKEEEWKTVNNRGHYPVRRRSSSDEAIWMSSSSLDDMAPTSANVAIQRR